jgi:hypothetical protein
LEAILAEYVAARASQPFAGHALRSRFEQVAGAIAATDAVEERPTLAVKASIGQGNWAAIPWIALLDSRETDKIQRGVYCVYLFREDMSGVYLTLAQGVTELKKQYGGDSKAREQLRSRAMHLRRWCEDLDHHGFALDESIDLRTRGTLGKNYEASTIAHKFYAAGSVPDDLALDDDLEAVLTAYDRYSVAKNSNSRLWCVYVGRGAAGNLEIARSTGTWGADAENKFEGVKQGDSLLFVHDLTSDASPPPRGFPRVRLADFRGTAKLLVWGTVSTEVFEDHSPRWPDDSYPHRFRFEETNESRDVAFNTETFPQNVVDAARRSTLAQGRPILATGVGEDVQPEQSPSTELAERTNLTQQELEEIGFLLNEKRQMIFEGPPGAGKTYVAELFARHLTDNGLEGPHDERIVVVQFHQSYGYEDFVQGIRPETNAKGQLEYRVQDGVFKRLCDVAKRNPDKNFVVVIDEINRGNISRIFGELLFLLEYRDKQVSLPYSRPADPEFSIPENVYLIGTMNTTDRSLAQIDYALRRRYYFYRMLPVVGGTAPVLGRWLEKQGIGPEERERVLRLFVALNERVQLHLGEHYQVGHSYLMTPDIATGTGRERVWAYAVMPLLEEYFYNHRDKAEVLAEFEPSNLLSDQG